VKNVWIINHYAPHPLKSGKVALHLQLAREMRKVGWEVQIVLASTRHPEGSQTLSDGVSTELVEWNKTETLFVRARSYHNGGLGRAINMAEFGSRLFFRQTMSKLARPDLIVGRITNPLAAIAARRWSQRLNVPFVLEISDIWPDTFVQLGAWSENGLKSRLLRQVERKLIRSASAVMSPLPGVGRYLYERGFDRTPFYWVPNGGDPSTLVSTDESSHMRDPGFRFMYMGSLGHANAVDTIINAFDVYTRDNNDSTAMLEIVGTGPLRDQLQKYAASLTSEEQIQFTGRVPNSELPKHLAKADVLVANMRDLPLYNYGIALNKLFDYLLSAKPIIFASNAINNVIDEAEAGITVRADDEIALAEAMKEMTLTKPDVRREWGKRGRRFVLETYTYAHAAKRFNIMLNDLTN